MDVKIIKSVRSDLIKNSDEKTKNGFHRYFKEEVKFHGVKMHLVDKVAKEYFQTIKDKHKEEIFSLCEDLLKSGYCEEAWVAGSWAYWIYKQYESKDIETFERWIDKYIDNWAECDNFCNHAVGKLVEQYPELVERLKQWTKSPNRWVKRASAVSLILPARKGLFLQDIIEIADSLLLDIDDIVQKGYGWMLKESSKAHQKEVFDYVMENKRVMPRTALRYAIEKMPQDLRKKAMEK